MRKKVTNLDVGIFAEAIASLDTFVNNLHMAEYFKEVVEGHIQLQKEYEEALLSNDKGIIAEKEAETEIYSSSFAMTYHLFDPTEVIMEFDGQRTKADLTSLRNAFKGSCDTYIWYKSDTAGAKILKTKLKE